jgi:hypothetical protein
MSEYEYYETLDKIRCKGGGLGAADGLEEEEHVLEQVLLAQQRRLHNREPGVNQV